MGHDTLPQRCALLDSDEAGRTYGRPPAGRLGRRLGKRNIAIGTVIDAAVIGRCCDGAIFLIQPGSVRYRDAQKAFAQLERSGCRVLGAVMNKIDTSSDKYYSSYYKHYGEYYRRSDDESQK